MKINPPDKIETIEVILSEERYPAAYAAKLRELTDPQFGCGLSEDQARKHIASTPFVLEIHYQTGYGLFAVESEALEGAPGALVSPYNGEPLEDPEG